MTTSRKKGDRDLKPWQLRLVDDPPARCCGDPISSHCFTCGCHAEGCSCGVRRPTPARRSRTEVA
jgi:hypothetical protein